MSTICSPKLEGCDHEIISTKNFEACKKCGYFADLRPTGPEVADAFVNLCLDKGWTNDDFLKGCLYAVMGETIRISKTSQKSDTVVQEIQSRPESTIRGSIL